MNYFPHKLAYINVPAFRMPRNQWKGNMQCAWKNSTQKMWNALWKN